MRLPASRRAQMVALLVRLRGVVGAFKPRPTEIRERGPMVDLGGLGVLLSISVVVVPGVEVARRSREDDSRCRVERFVCATH